MPFGDRLGAALDVELGEDVADVDLDRVEGEDEPVRNFLVGQPGRDQMENFQLTAAQRLDLGRGVRAAGRRGDRRMDGERGQQLPRIVGFNALSARSVEQLRQGRALVDKGTDISLRPGKGQGAGQVGGCGLKVVEDGGGQRVQDPDFDYTAHTPARGRRTGHGHPAHRPLRPLLQQALHLGFTLRPWSKDIANSLRKEPRWFLRDWSGVSDVGRRAETLVGCHLLKAVEGWTDLGLGSFELAYLRTKQGQEVDFVIIRDRKPWCLVEVKQSASDLSPSLAFFQERTKAPHAFQVELDAPYEAVDCFAHRGRPLRVPARTFLSQLL